MKPGFWKSTLLQRCPRCNEGKLFHQPLFSLRFAKMEDRCRVCGQDFIIEDGFFLGATYVSYAISVALAVPLMLLLVLVFHWSLPPILAVLFGVLLIFMPGIVRISRAAWFSFFVRYDPDWEKKRIEELLQS
ncbi:MAG: DUF983 domain-containing protein [Flavobacteriales bacterium]|nr:DUF983 domain-containing protein [Flavobacteriales bacterium]MCX7767841.1 DUF983 domain-containing protein [Flavobacteriales bacterium]MDW8410661.1 DUF983 domain-containing protein [Flavobacteriales bacterium]